MREDDRGAIMLMGAHFLAGTHYGEVFDALVPEADLMRGIDRLITLAQELGPNAATCLVADSDGALVGMLAIAIGPHILTGQLFAEEIAWWVEPSRRGKVGVALGLLDAAEAWARGNGVAFLKMIEPVGTQIGKLYARRGYRAIETGFAKRL
jgi:GNAT superfamily N-acetyltransferase